MEKTKLEDLEFLQHQRIPGPMATKEKVIEFMESEPDSKEKNERIYREVRFQRNSSQSLRKDAVVFRLRRNRKNLDTEKYASNLSLYLDQSRNMSSLTISDLRNVLTGLSETNSKSESTANDTGTEKREGDSEFCYGEHVACFWYDNQESRYQWHLGVIDGMDGEKVVVSHMKRSDRVGRNWLFPEKADVHATGTDQILMRHIQVNYTLTAMIRCQISSETVGQIETELSKINID